MNLERLRYFAIVAETKNLRRAAELIGMSPGALSRSLKSLEQELSVRLFSMDGRVFALTEEGRSIYPMAQRLLAESTAFERALKNRTPSEAPVRFCSHSVFTTYFLGYTLKHLLPDMEVLARNAPPGAIEASVLNRESDFGLTYLPIAREGIDFLPVVPIAMGAFMRHGAFPGIAPIDIPCSAPILNVVQATGGTLPIDAWPSSLSRRNIRYHFDLLETALESCRQGLSLGYFPIFVVWLHNAQVRKDYQLQAVAGPGLQRNRLQAFLVRRSGTDETLPQKRFCKALRLVCRQSEQAIKPSLRAGPQAARDR